MNPDLGPARPRVWGLPSLARKRCHRRLPRDEFGVHPIGTMSPRSGSRHSASQLPANERPD